MGGVCARVTAAYIEQNDPDSAFPLYIGRICTNFFACGANTPTEAAVAEQTHRQKPAVKEMAAMEGLG
jgi:hypothetical protein